MQWISDHFVWTVVILGAVHIVIFVTLVRLRVRNIKSLLGYLDDLVRDVSNHTDKHLARSLDDCTLGDLHVDLKIDLGRKRALGDVW